MSDPSLLPGALNFQPGICPSCKHPQHVGAVCGREVSTVTDSDGTTMPIRCACSPLLAIKQDGEKQKNFHLFAWDALPELIQIYEYGLQKGYLEDSWRDVPPEKYRDALVRHMIGLLTHGFDHLDPESGKRTVAHLAWNANTLMVLTRKR